MPFLEHVIILCGTNNVNKDSPFDNKCKRVDHTLDEEKIKSTIPTWQYVKLVFFSTNIYFRLYSNILNNISIKTHYLTNLYVYLLISLLNCLIWQLMFVFGVPIKYLLEENKLVICIAFAFLNRSKCKCVPNSSDLCSLSVLKNYSCISKYLLITLMKMVDRVVNNK